jgi:uncharacterized protein YcgI (DUF1989 family)
MNLTADNVPGAVLSDEIIGPAGYCAREVRRGEIVRIVDIEGQQVVGLACVNLDRPEEKLSAPNTFGLNRQIYPGLGYELYSDEAGLMMTITADTCGTHAMIAGACSSYMNELRYGEKRTPNCRDNFAMAVKSWGLGWKDVPYPINVFMNLVVGSDGSYEIDLPKSKPGDFADFTADMDLLVAISNYPQDKNKVNAFKLSPVRVIHFRPESG